MKVQPFHLAIPVQNLQRARKFYGNILACPEGRSADQWVDFNFFGHQLVIHVKDGYKPDSASNPVDGHDVPIPHFGVVLSWKDWEELSQRLTSHNIDFIIKPYVRFKGLPGEQATMFFKDTEGNALEFKAFQDISQLFAK